MKLPRRNFLRLAAGSAALPFVSRTGWAQAYPNKPVRIIAPFPPGGTIDLWARVIGQWLSERLNQQFIVENRSGAGGNLGAEYVARSPADGYTLLQLSSVNPLGVWIHDKPGIIQDLAPVASILSGAHALITHPSFPATSVPELIDYAKKNPGKITMASSGVGTPDHVYGELFNSMVGITMLHVPYRGGGPKMTDLLAGQVHLSFEPVSTGLEYIRAGRVRALAVTSMTRQTVLPEVPALHEYAPGYEGIGWQGIAAPRNTPAPIIQLLNKEINAGLENPRIKERIAQVGATVFASTPEEFSAFVTAYTEKWGKVIRAANIKAE